MSDSLEERLDSVRGRVSEAARTAGRSADELTLVVVTKFHPVELVRELVALGVHDFGENRHQEAREKAALLPGERWHFVGQLQSNKARQVRAYADVVQSVDRASLVGALGSDDGSTLDVFLQVDLGDRGRDGAEAGRGGADPDEVPALVEQIAGSAGLALLGVMAVAPLGEEPARAFGRLAGISDQVRRMVPSATAISAGMTGDFEDAIRAGATHLRIGTAITGARPRPQYPLD